MASSRDNVIKRFGVEYADVTDTSPEGKRRVVLARLTAAAKAGDTGALKAFFRMFCETLYTPIPDTCATPRLDNKQRDVVARLVAEGGNKVSGKALARFINQWLSNYRSYDEFVACADNAAYIADGFGPAIYHMFTHARSAAPI